jgi:hypothetical protein
VSGICILLHHGYEPGGVHVDNLIQHPLANVQLPAVEGHDLLIGGKWLSVPFANLKQVPKVDAAIEAGEKDTENVFTVGLSLLLKLVFETVLGRDVYFGHCNTLWIGMQGAIPKAPLLPKSLTLVIVVTVAEDEAGKPDYS